MAAMVPRFISLRLPCIGRMARRPCRNTQMWPPFAGSKHRVQRQEGGSHRIIVALLSVESSAIIAIDLQYHPY